MQLETLREIVEIGGLTGLVGTVIHFVWKKKSFTWRTFIYQIILACFVGMLSSSVLLNYTDFSSEIVCTICSLLSSMATKVLDRLEELFDGTWLIISEGIKSRVKNIFTKK